MDGGGPAGRRTNLVPPRATYASMTAATASGGPTAVTARRVASSARSRGRYGSAARQPSAGESASTNGMMVPKWSASIARPASAAWAWMLSTARPNGSGATSEAGQPSPRPPAPRRAASLLPPAPHPGRRRRVDGAREEPHPVRREVRAPIAPLVLDPQPADHLDGLVGPGAPAAGGHAGRLPLAPLLDPQPHRREHPALREDIER